MFLHFQHQQCSWVHWMVAQICARLAFCSAQLASKLSRWQWSHSANESKMRITFSYMWPLHTLVHKVNFVPGKNCYSIKTILPVSLVCWWYPRACLHRGIIFSDWQVTNNCEKTSLFLWIITPLTASRHRDSWQDRAQRSEIAEWSGWCQTDANLCTFYLIPAECWIIPGMERAPDNNRKHQSNLC